MRVAAGLVLLSSVLMMRVAFGQTPTASETGLTGVITISPAHPGPTREDVPNSKPLANCAFSAKGSTGTSVSFTADAEGRFKVSLPPGHYTISLTQKVRRCGPFEVDIVEGKMIAVDWQCDSGMR